MCGWAGIWAKTTVTYDQGRVPFRLRLTNKGDLSNEILPNQNISGSQVPVNQPFPLQVSHAIGHLFFLCRKLQKISQEF